MDATPFKKGSPQPGRALFIFRGRESKRSERQTVAATRPGMAASAGRGDSGKESYVAGDLTPSPGSGDKGVREDPERPFRIRQSKEREEGS
jgi:hypothetical protein